jgi:hypothetical protein
LITKIKAGILSGIGLMFVYVLKGILLIPGLDISNTALSGVIIQIGFLWFSVSLWISLKYVLVVLNKQINLKLNLRWIINNLATIGGAGLIYIVFPRWELYLIIYLLGAILIVNYIIFWVKVYRLDKNDLNHIKDLHNYIISIIVVIFIGLFVHFFNEFKWHRDLEYIVVFLNIVPIMFLVHFLRHERLDVRNYLNARDNV